jgi:hypothetical protein
MSCPNCRRSLLALVMATLVVATLPLRAEDQTNNLTDNERAAGWKLLFDGKSTTGWRKYQGDSVPEMWTASEGALVFQPQNSKVHGNDIVTQDQYENFELALEWKISEGGNSGIMYRVSESGPFPWTTGPEYQICDNARHADGKRPLTSAASCYAVYAVSRDVTKPAGQWNQTRLVVNGNHVEHWLNGEKVVEYELGSDDWKAKVQASKFRTMPGYGKEAKGHICLQDHGDRVEFRNIKIRVLGEK